MAFPDFDKPTDDAPADKPKAEPFGGTPKDTQPEESGDAASMVADAKASGKLKPLEDVMKEQGWDMDAGTALLLAQKKQAPGTQGKSPEELAEMLRSDPSVYEDLQALQPGGALDMLGKKDGPPPMEGEEPKPEGGKKLPLFGEK
jgi:hypothetical protein